LGKKAFRRVTWRNGSMQGRRGKLNSRFALARVKVAHDDGREPERREPLWLLIEWPDGEAAPTKYALTTLPRTMSKKQLVRLFKERYRTERVYEEMKCELGLDHFEGRSFLGWHHHISVAICCYAFVIAERMRHFPPRPDGPVPLVRTPSRPERHFADSFATIRLAIARVLACWLPRCPLCHRPLPTRHHDRPRVAGSPGRKTTQ
jgi:SRSO17 transposase